MALNSCIFTVGLTRTSKSTDNSQIIYEWEELDVLELETCFFTVRPCRMPRDFTHITFGVVYHPPKADDRAMCQHLIQCVDRILLRFPNTGLFICGDVNTFKDSYFKSSLKLKQIVIKPTRGKNTLDKCYTNMACFYGEPLHQPGFGLSDHQVVICSPSTHQFKAPSRITISKRCQGPNNRAMFMYALKNIQWQELYMMNTCAEQFHLFSTTMTNLIDEHLPLKQVSRNSNDKPWITDKFLEMIELRQYHFNKENTTEYKHYRNTVNRMRNNLVKDHYAKQKKDLGEISQKDWWKKIKEITGLKKENNNLQGLANTLHEGDMDKLADNINASFQGVSADMTALTPHESFTVGNSYHVPDIYIISVSKVEKQLMNTKTNKAIGPDNIPNWILRDLAPLIAGPICAIYNSSFREGFLPQIWKSADVIPLPKIEPPKLVDKHLRPISLTPVLSKGAEEHARGWIMEFMEEVLDQHQFGSRKGHSTVHALVELHHQWLEAVETTGRVVRVLMLDFRKAFDRVDHHILLTKLSNLGLPDFLVRWMTAFLCERQQRVKIGQTTSSW